MKIEGNFCDIDELTFGVFAAYGEDELGSFHMVTIGIIFFEVNFIKYKKE